MITIRYDEPNLTVSVEGHVDDHRTCGAMSMLMRGYGVIAKCYTTEPGRDFIEMDARDRLDYEALVHGLECLLFFCEEDNSMLPVESVDDTETL